jgi:hypothetical protein
MLQIQVGMVMAIIEDKAAVEADEPVNKFQP